MDSWKQYVLSIITCAFICGILSQIISDTKRKALMRLVFGTVLAIFLLRPFSDINIENVLERSLLDQTAANLFIAEGEKTAAEAKTEYIKASCEAYILDKAAKLGTEVSAEIFLDHNLMPTFAEIEGALTPDLQMQLQTILTDDLGIPKENQSWIWNQEANSS